MTSGIPPAAYVLLAAPPAALLAAFFLFHRLRPSQTHWPVLASCVAATAASWWLAWRVRAGLVIDETLWRWLGVGGFAADFGLRIDGLNAPVLAMVALVSTLIHVYAVGYMRDDPGFSRFFIYFHFFFFSMVGLLVSNNYLQLYLFWEGVGLASFLLIAFWHDKPSARAAAWKAFLTNRVGDAAFLLAVLLLLGRAGSSRFTEVFARLDGLPPGFIALVALLLFWGASAKSAQFPLHVWLPDAMEGPTPVSALMHAATMVTAGVFLMARSWPLLERAPEVRLLVACIGALTALGAAVVAATQKDLKRILAYSTVSHLGLMMLAIGCGSVYAAIFHLITHGFFKALLFLCAGNVICGLGRHGSVELADAGGLARSLPATYACFLVGALALGGIPPLSGFFSKDLILEAVFERGPAILRLAGLLTAAGSCFYILRMLLLTFAGGRDWQAGPRAHAHEAGPWMLAPVVALAVLSALAGIAGPSGALSGMLGVSAPHFSLSVAGWGLAFAAAGAAAAWLAAQSMSGWDLDWRMRRPRLERAIGGEFGWQAAVSAAARSGGSFAGWLAQEWDIKRWDRFLSSLADTCVGLGEGLSGLSRGLLNEYLWWMTAGAVAVTLAAALCI